MDFVSRGGGRSDRGSTVIVGLLPAHRSSTAAVALSGQLEPMVSAYLKAFDSVAEFDYRGWPWLPRDQWRRLRACSVVRVLSLTGSLPAVIAHRLWGIPYVTALNFDHAAVARFNGRPWKSWLYRALEMVAIPRAAGVLVSNLDLLAHMTNRWPWVKALYLPNGVDLVEFTPGPSHPLHDPPVVSYVGRESPEKNLDRLREAVDLVTPHPRLQIVMGRPHAEIADLLRASDVFVLPSLTEGSPKALWEAMACGVPCVASRAAVPLDCPALQFDPYRPDLLAAQIMFMLTMTDERRAIWGQAGRAYVERNHDLRVLLAREVEFVKAAARG